MEDHTPEGKAEKRRRCSDMRDQQKVYLYHPEIRLAQKAPADDLQPLIEHQRTRAARWFANCTPDEIGPEAVMTFRLLREILLIKRLNVVRVCRN